METERNDFESEIMRNYWNARVTRLILHAVQLFVAPTTLIDDTYPPRVILSRDESDVLLMSRVEF